MSFAAGNLGPDLLSACPRCGSIASPELAACPNCGTSHPGLRRPGWGFEWRSHTEIFGLPLLHVSFKYRPNRSPVPATGIIAIGQFACGVVTISQFGIGLFSLGQFTIAGFAVAQMAIAYSLIAQFGAYWHEGHGQFVVGIVDLIRRLS